MVLRPTRDNDVQLFKQLCIGDRLEEQTCRPIIEGKRLEADQRRENWSFVVADDNSPAGWVTLFNFNSRNRSAEFGFGVVPPLRGRGVAKEMLTAAFDLFFPSMDLNKLYCQTASFNTASVRLLESLEMTRDAILRAHHELDGELHDDYVYSILRDEWGRQRRYS